jgi:hypothetical protein
MSDPVDEVPEHQTGAGEPPPEGARGAALQRAAATWERRGYQVREEDEYLIGLVRRLPPSWGLIGLVGLSAVLTVAALALALTRRRWHIVRLAATPDGRVVTHGSRALRLPPL